MTKPPEEARVVFGELVVAETVDDVHSLVGDLIRLERRTPIVCLTSRRDEELPALDPQVVREIVGTNVPVWFVPTGDLTIELGRRLPRGLGITDGEARIYWPGVDAASDGRDHPVVRDRHRTYTADALRRFRDSWERGPIDRDRLPTAVQEELARLRSAQARLLAEAAQLAKELVDARTQVERERARARSLEDRLRRVNDPSRRRVEPTQPATLDPRAAFFLMVAQAWATAFESDDLARRPLGQMRFHDEFLADVGRLTEQRRQRVAWVCAMVACGLTPDGLEVHPLRTGRAPAAPPITRGDGARAMRCAIQRNAPAALRLHWWALPGGEIEFANVGVHDRIYIAG